MLTSTASPPGVGRSLPEESAPVPPASSRPSAVPRAALADGTACRVAAAYDFWADPYTELFGEVDALAPEDRALILRWARSRTGPLLDAGCGPGTWTRFLAQRRPAPVIGLDLSARFLAIARAREPASLVVRGSLGSLPFPTGSLDGVLAWYSLIHTPPTQLDVVLAELRRVLRVGGSLLVGFVDGTAGEPFDHRVTTAYAWTCEALGARLGAAGFAVQEAHRRRDDGVRPHADLVAVAVGPGAAPGERVVASAPGEGRGERGP